MKNISIDVIKDNESYNLTITSINEDGFSIIPHYDFFIISPCLEYGILFSFNVNTIQNYLNDLDYIYKPDYFPLIYKCNAYNITLIFFSIINAIYIQKFILSIKKNNLLIFSISLEFFTINTILHFIHYYYSFDFTLNIFSIKSSWKIKLINCLGTSFIFINLIIFDERLLKNLFKKLKINCCHKVIHIAICISFLLIVSIVYFLKKTEFILFCLIFQSIMWAM